MRESPWFLVIGEHFATTVLICLWPCYRRKVEFPNVALLCVALLWVGVYCENGIFYYLPTDLCFDDITCYDLEPFWYVLWKVSYFSQVILPLGLAYQVLYCILSWYRYVVGEISNCSGQQTTAESIFRGTISAVSFLSMWIDLAIFGEMRTGAHQFLGQSYLEDRWAYGQILTVMTWFSIFVEYLRLFLCKSQLTTLRHFCEIFCHRLRGNRTSIRIANLHFQGMNSTTISAGLIANAHCPRFMTWFP